MAVFSDLPNELIINIWGYVVEPQSVENFALVSKRVYELATPFVEEHRRLRQRYARILDLGKGKHGRAAELLEAMLLNPRVAVYINELQIRGWADVWEDQDGSIQTQSYAGKTMDVFEDAIRSLSHITPLERACRLVDMRTGHEGPLLALILMQLTELKKLEIYPCYSDSDGSLDDVLRGLVYPLEISGPHRLNGASSPLSKSPHISDLVIKYCDIEYRTISNLLRSTKNLKKFSYYGKRNSCVEPHQICYQLLKYSRQSLQKLCLKSNGRIEYPYKVTIRDAISRFEKLVELEIGEVFLFGDGDDDCKTLIDMLPISIETVSLYMRLMVAYETLRGTIFQMVEHKVVHLPNLKALTFEQSFDHGSYDETRAPVTRTEFRDTESFADLSQKSAEVGVFLSVAEYEFNNSRNDHAVFQAYMS